MNAIFEEKNTMVFKGKWVEKNDDFYLDECPENNLFTLQKEYDVVIISVNGVKYVSVLNDKGDNNVLDLDLFWSLSEFRDIKLKSIGI